MKSLKIAIGIDDTKWWQQFSAALDEKRRGGYPLEYETLDLARHDWLQAVAPFDVVLWKPQAMGMEAAAHFKEKIYVLEQHLGKVVMPSYGTIWHFESKIAQSYLFEIEGVPTPKTSVSFSHSDAVEQLRSTQMPLVFKKSHGAGSQHVQLIHSTRPAMRQLSSAFCAQIYRSRRIDGASKLQTVLRGLGSRWFWQMLLQSWRGTEPSGYAYWQNFIPANDADLRITVIGDRYAYGFWRRNRRGDFRASGSGQIDYQRPIPEEPLRYCLALNRRLKFDSMAYDILFQGSQFVINEISYAYLDSAPHRTAGHYELDEQGELAFVEGHVWPQTLWVEWLLHKAEKVQA